MSDFKNFISGIFIIFILGVTTFSCESGKDCNSAPDISGVDQQKLDEQVERIENYLDSVGYDYISDPSGVRVVTIKEGEGLTANFCSAVNLSYAGSVVGEEEYFDEGVSLNFQLDDQNLIKGWYYGLFNMKKEGEYRMYIPSPLAYGSDTLTASSGEVILLPNSNLEFRIRVNAIFNN